MTDRVKFPFGDRVLEGEVVHRTLDPRFDATGRTRLIVDVDGAEYATLASEAELVEDVGR